MTMTEGRKVAPFPLGRARSAPTLRRAPTRVLRDRIGAEGARRRRSCRARGVVQVERGCAVVLPPNEAAVHDRLAVGGGGPETGGPGARAPRRAPPGSR